MKHRAVMEAGEWIFARGKSGYERGNNAVMLNVRTRLMSFTNDCFFDLEAGIDWWNLLGGKNRDLLLKQIKSTILDSYGVKEIVKFDAKVNAERVFEIGYTLTLTDNEQETDNVKLLQM
jgi:hypothetical protein